MPTEGAESETVPLHELPQRLHDRLVPGRQPVPIEDGLSGKLLALKRKKPSGSMRQIDDEWELYIANTTIAHAVEMTGGGIASPLSAADPLRDERGLSQGHRVRFTARFPIFDTDGDPWQNARDEPLAACLVVTGLRTAITVSGLPDLDSARAKGASPTDVADGLAGQDAQFDLDQLCRHPAQYGLFTPDPDYGIRPVWIDNGDSLDESGKLHSSPGHPRLVATTAQVLGGRAVFDRNAGNIRVVTSGRRGPRTLAEGTKRQKNWWQAPPGGNGTGGAPKIR